MRFFARYLSIIFLLVSQTIGDAQEMRKVTCRFLALLAESPPPGILNVGENNLEVPCSINTDVPSPEIGCYALGNTISFIGASDKKLIAKATLPASGNAFILLFLPGPKSETGPSWRIFVIENTAKTFPDGGAYVVNFYKQDIRFVVGEHKFMLKPGGAHGLAMPSSLDNFNMAPVIFEFQQGEDWKLAKETSLRFLPGSRYMMFAYSDPATNQPRITTCRDFN